MDVNDKSLEELTTEEFNSVVNKISVQFSYIIDPIGRIHIRQTGDYITGLEIDDDVEFYWEGVPSMETDLIMKVAIRLMRYCKKKLTDLNDIPILVKNDDIKYIEFLNRITEIPYGKVIDIRRIKGFKYRYKKLLKGLHISIIIPIHRINGCRFTNNYYDSKLRKLESSS